MHWYLSGATEAILTLNLAVVTLNHLANSIRFRNKIACEVADIGLPLRTTGAI